jgi:hypothetical protein
MNTPCRGHPRRLPRTRPPPSRSTAPAPSRVAMSAGVTEQPKAVNSDITDANTRTFESKPVSAILGISAGAQATRHLTNTHATTAPPTAAIDAAVKLSTPNWEAICNVVAPSDLRVATSRARANVRERNRLLAAMQLATRRISAATSAAQSCGRAVPAQYSGSAVITASCVGEYTPGCSRASR